MVVEEVLEDLIVEAEAVEVAAQVVSQKMTKYFKNVLHVKDFPTQNLRRWGRVWWGRKFWRRIQLW